jgi:hypothetical protein
MTASPDFGIPYVAAQQAQPEVTHNEAIAVMQALMKGVVNMTTATPPGSPTDGDAYVIAASPTGAWAGRAGAIAVYVGNAWRFIPGNTSAGSAIAMGARHEGMRVYNQADDRTWIWSGAAWVPMLKQNGLFEVIAASAVAVSHTAGATTEQVLATVTIPAGAMGANGRLRVTSIWTITNSANSKNIRVRFGGSSGTIFQQPTVTSIASVRMQCEIGNRNNQASQVGTVANTTGFPSSVQANITAAIDTTVAQDLVFTALISTIGETIALESHMVELLSKS